MSTVKEFINLKPEKVQDIGNLSKEITLEGLEYIRNGVTLVAKNTGKRLQYGESEPGWWFSTEDNTLNHDNNKHSRVTVEVPVWVDKDLVYHFANLCNKYKYITVELLAYHLINIARNTGAQFTVNFNCNGDNYKLVFKGEESARQNKLLPRKTVVTKSDDFITFTSVDTLTGEVTELGYVGKKNIDSINTTLEFTMNKNLTEDGKETLLHSIIDYYSTDASKGNVYMVLGIPDLVDYKDILLRQYKNIAISKDKLIICPSYWYTYYAELDYTQLKSDGAHLFVNLDDFMRFITGINRSGKNDYLVIHITEAPVYARQIIEHIVKEMNNSKPNIITI